MWDHSREVMYSPKGRLLAFELLRGIQFGASSTTTMRVEHTAMAAARLELGAAPAQANPEIRSTDTTFRISIAPHRVGVDHPDVPRPIYKLCCLATCKLSFPIDHSHSHNDVGTYRTQGGDNPDGGSSFRIGHRCQNGRRGGRARLEVCAHGLQGHGCQVPQGLPHLYGHLYRCSI